ncbi:MAG: cytochrome c biogenesis protein CcdA [Vallitaleaceae bacterium]|nr:cytochrome c biogenesis protein CcdA [Vallitaleaceae bacterium]
MNVSYMTAFGSGVMTFFLPCILPMLPLYFSYLAGEALDGVEKNKKIRARLILNSVGFALGLSVLNILLGFGARLLSSVLLENKELIRILGGIFMIVFGSYFISGLNLSFMEKEKKVVYRNYAPSFLKSFILGFVFSLGWSACSGPIIASISVIASFQKDYFRAGTLMLTYSAGFSVMFILSAILAGTFLPKMKIIQRHMGLIKKISGGILVIMGLLLVFDKITWLA